MVGWHRTLDVTVLSDCVSMSDGSACRPSRSRRRTTATCWFICHRCNIIMKGMRLFIIACVITALDHYFIQDISGIVFPVLIYKIQTLKPIFHCDAKPFALGTGVRLDPQRHIFASPNAKDTNMLVSENAKTPDAKPKICVLPNAKPKRKPV